MHYLTDGKEKYVWFPTTGVEQFFDLVNDRQELRDLAQSSACASRVAMWRQRLVEHLARRPDGFSDGRNLLIRKDRWSAVAQGRA